MHILLLFYGRIILALKLKSDAKTKISRTRNFWKKTPIFNCLIYTLHHIYRSYKQSSEKEYFWYCIIYRIRQLFPEIMSIFFLFQTLGESLLYRNCNNWSTIIYLSILNHYCTYSSTWWKSCKYDVISFQVTHFFREIVWRIKMHLTDTLWRGRPVVWWL